jgi:5-methylcytosine-specific restriction endonuclease McrA
MDEYPLTRKIAQGSGSKYYRTGKLCKLGHLEKRYTSTGQCVSCVGESTIQWKDKNKSWFPEYCRKYARKRHWENRDQIIQKTREWRINNPEKQKELNKKWNERNPEAKRLYENKRRSRKKGAGGSHTIKQLREMLIRQNFKCVYCKCDVSKSYHIDHIVPISRGGNNAIENIQILCVDCNQSKHNKMPEDFLLVLSKRKGLK